MKRRLLLLILLAHFSAASFGSPASADSGGISSGGGGGGDAGNPFRDTAWFGDPKREIKTCLKISSRFGLSEEEIRPQVERAFQSWIAYIDAKRVESEMERRAPNAFGFARSLRFLKTCDGSEDLTLLFGENPKTLEKYKKLFNDPVAMAIRTKHDRRTTWSKGFIWLAAENSLNTSYPDWHGKNNIVTIMLHELGHVFGCSHVAGTIMTESIQKLLINRNQVAHSFKTSIDITRELFICRSCTTVFDNEHAVLSGGGEGPYSARQALVDKIMGYHVETAPKVKLTRLGENGKYRLALTDELNHQTLEFDLVMTGSKELGGAFVFAVDWLGWANSDSRIHYTYLVNPRGEKVPLILEENLTTSLMSWPEAGHPMSLSGIADGEYTNLVSYSYQFFLE